MHTHPDADAFMREYLAHPTDATTRLVFADWLDETGEPPSAAWASYIRRRDEADRHPPQSREHRELLHQADEYAPKIRAKLTMSATRFVGHPKSLLQLLPAANISVRLAGFEVPRSALDYMPESIARENLLLLLDVQGDTLLIAITDPRDSDLAQKLQFILNRYVVLVGAEQEDVLRAINRLYGPVEFYDTHVTYVGDYLPAELTPEHHPAVRLVNLIFAEAVNLRADRVLVYPDFRAIVVRYRIDGEWVERDSLPMRLLRPVIGRIAEIAGIGAGRVFDEPYPANPLTGKTSLAWRDGRFRLRVTIQPSPDGTIAQIDIAREPVV